MGAGAASEGSVGRAGRPPLVGREVELAALCGVLRAAGRHRERRTAFIEGEAGIGKTRLLEEALASPEAAGFELWRGGGHELGREQPFGALAEALGLTLESPDPRARELARLITGPPRAEGSGIVSGEAPDVRFRVVEGLIALVEDAASKRPLLLALEDLQWADPSTLLTLDRLRQRLAFLPVVLLGTCRPYPRTAELAALLDGASESGLHLRVESLGAAAARALAVALLGAEAGPGLSDRLHATGGNPLFVIELIGSLNEEGAIELVCGRAEVRESALPSTLRLTVLRRLRFLGEDALETLRIASVLGSSFSVADLALVAGRRIPNLLRPLHEAHDAAVLLGEGDRLRFRHDLVREAIYEDLPAPLRVGLHLQAARALAAAGRPAAQVAAHFALGAPAGDRQAVEWLRRGAAQAAPRAPTVAVGFLRRAVELLPEEDAPGEVVRMELVRSLLWAGRLAEAERLARQLLAAGIAAEAAAPLHYVIGRALAYQGRLEDSIRHAEHALAQPDLAPGNRARLLAEVSHRRLLSGDVEGAARAAQDASGHGDPVARWTAGCALAWVAAARGELARADQLAAEAVAMADRHAHDPIGRLQPRLYRAFVCVDSDRLEEAEGLLREGLAIAEEGGAAWALPLHNAALAVLHWHTGAWDDAVAEAETSLVLAHELDTRVWTPLAYGVIASIALHRDDLVRCQELLRQASAESSTRSARFWSDRLAIAQALLVEAGGDQATALDGLVERWLLTRARGWVGEWREMVPQLVRLAPATHRPQLAVEVVAAVETIPAVRELPAASGAALLCRGWVQQDPATMVRAVQALRGSVRPLEHAGAAEAAALVARPHGRAEAVGLLHEALEVYEQLGAARAVARTEATLRQLGVRRGRRGPRKRPAQGWDSLTPSEQRIASLIAEGLTNPQIAERLFLSRRTVETHVSHALTKLRLSSRVQLAAQAARRELSYEPPARTSP